MMRKALAMAALVVIAGMVMVGTCLLDIEIDDPYDPYE